MTLSGWSIIYTRVLIELHTGYCKFRQWSKNAYKNL